jgi:hypothetical protein
MNAEMIVKVLIGLLNEQSQAEQKCAKKPASRFVIVRCTAAGVHAGYLVNQDGPVVRLRDARRLWQWQVPHGAPAFLSGVAVAGLDYQGSKVGATIDLTVVDACEIIDASADAEKSIRNAPVESRIK